MYSFKKVSHGGQGSQGWVVVWGVLGWFCLLNVSAWGQFSGGSGTVGDPYLISTSADMQTLSANSVHWDKHFKLTADLNLIGVVMTPIGTSGKKFTGTFDGDGDTITNLMINLPASDNVGLFGFVNSAFDPTLFNLGLINPDITGRNLVGALAGRLFNGTLSGCTVDGGTVNGEQLVGGLAGDNDGTISDSYATVAVSGTRNVGGLVGHNFSTISNSYSTGTVTGTSLPFFDGVFVGGLAGDNDGTISDSYATGVVTGNSYSSSGFALVGGLVGRNFGSISNSYASGSVTGVVTGTSSDARVGGLVGLSSGPISACYATGTVTGSVTGGSSFARVGGLVGHNFSTISNSYSTGQVSASGTSIVGGLVGSNSGTVSNSFWDTQTSGQASSAGGTGKTTAQMKQQATFTGWDFVNTWGIFENQTYPLLKAILLCVQDGTGHPLGDVNKDCLYNILDFVFSAQFWLEDRNWQP